MTVRDEVFEQPRVLRNLYVDGADTVRAIASRMRQADPSCLLAVARGSSDNAALFGKYLFGAQNGIVVAMATPSLFTLYGSPPRLRDAWVLGLSQSGQSPDLVEVMARAHEQGVESVVVTNSPDSPMARLASHVIDIGVGPERAVAATKSYTAQLYALAMLSAALTGSSAAWDELAALPDLVSAALASEDAVQDVARRLAAARPPRTVVLSRGFNYATAFELSLKLEEMSGISCERYSTADFEHGPITLSDKELLAIVVAPGDETRSETARHLDELHRRRAQRLVLSDDASLLARAEYSLRLPPVGALRASPIVAIVVGQLFAWHLAVALGRDPDAPIGLEKVTRTR